MDTHASDVADGIKSGQNMPESGVVKHQGIAAAQDDLREAGIRGDAIEGAPQALLPYGFSIGKRATKTIPAVNRTRAGQYEQRPAAVFMNQTAVSKKREFTDGIA